MREKNTMKMKCYCSIGRIEKRKGLRRMEKASGGEKDWDMMK